MFLPISNVMDSFSFCRRRSMKYYSLALGTVGFFMGLTFLTEDSLKEGEKSGAGFGPSSQGSFEEIVLPGAVRNIDHEGLDVMSKRIVSRVAGNGQNTVHTPTHCQCVQAPVSLSYCATGIAPGTYGKECNFRQCSPRWECVHTVPDNTRTRNCEKVVVKSNLACDIPINGDDGRCNCRRVNKPSTIWVPTD